MADKMLVTQALDERDRMDNNMLLRVAAYFPALNLLE